MTNLTQRAMLVKLKISAWTARKSDKNVERDIEVRHAAEPGVGSYLKYLLPRNKLLAETVSLRNYMHNVFVDSSLPWLDDGMRIMPNELIPEFMNKLRAAKPAWDEAVSALISSYKVAKEEAEISLGGLYRDDEYPTEKELAAKFGIDLRIAPVPTGDFRVDAIPPEEAVPIKEVFELMQEKATCLAQSELWSMTRSLLDRLQKPRNRLSQNKLADEVNRLKRLNFGMDKRLTEILDKISEHEFTGIDADIDETLEALNSKVSELQSKIDQAIAEMTTERILGVGGT